METYWIEYEDGYKGSCMGQGEYDATRIAQKLRGVSVTSIKRLPYPANPEIWWFDHPGIGKCPPFCYKPEQCAGHTSCPQSRACSE
jgi:hypothetical protein